MPSRARPAALLILLALAGCAAPRHLAEEEAWLARFNRWNQILESSNETAARDAAAASRGYRALRDSTRAAVDTLDRVAPDIRAGRAVILFNLLQRTRYNLLVTQHRKLVSSRGAVEGRAATADSLERSGSFAASRQIRESLDRGLDSLGVVVNELLAEDLQSAWDTLRVPLPRASAGQGWLAPRLRLSGDSIPPDPGEVRLRLEQFAASTLRLRQEVTTSRPALERQGWVRRANALMQSLNTAVRADSAGDHRGALGQLTAVRAAASSALAEMGAGSGPRHAAAAPEATPARPEFSHPSNDPEEAVREVLRLVELNMDAIRHGLAVDLYREISRRLAFDQAVPRVDVARLDSVLADPRLDPDLRRMILGLREDLEAVSPTTAPAPR